MAFRLAVMARGYILAAGSTRACLSCGSTGAKLTKEHVFPRWLYRALDPPSTMAYRVGGEIVSRWKAADLCVGGICIQCNNGWMHDLECAFRAVMLPAITGRAGNEDPPLLLDRAVQQVVATWTAKTWLLLELALRHVRSAAVEARPLLAYLYEHGCPTDELQVFLSVAPAPPTFAEFATIGLPHDESPPRAALSLLAIGHIALYLYAPLSIAGVRQGGPLILGGNLPLALPQVWPYQVPEVRWPTAVVPSRSGVNTAFGFNI